MNIASMVKDCITARDLIWYLSGDLQAPAAKPAG